MEGPLGTQLYKVLGAIFDELGFCPKNSLGRESADLEHVSVCIRIDVQTSLVLVQFLVQILVSFQPEKSANPSCEHVKVLVVARLEKRVLQIR